MSELLRLSVWATGIVVVLVGVNHLFSALRGPENTVERLLLKNRFRYRTGMEKADLEKMNEIGGREWDRCARAQSKSRRAQKRNDEDDEHVIRFRNIS